MAMTPVSEEIEGRWYRDGGEPCRDCATTGGYGDVGSTRPGRTRGLCKTCHTRHLRHGTVEQFPTVVTMLRRGGTRRVRLTSERRREKEAVIAARVAEHEGGIPLLPGDPFQVSLRTVGAERSARAWLRAHPEQVMGLSRRRTEVGWPAEALDYQAFPPLPEQPAA